MFVMNSQSATCTRRNADFWKVSFKSWEEKKGFSPWRRRDWEISGLISVCKQSSAVYVRSHNCFCWEIEHVSSLTQRVSIHISSARQINYNHITSSLYDSPLCLSTTPFHARLKTYLFHKSYPVVSLLPPGLPPQSIAWTGSSELLDFFFFIFPYYLFLCRALD